MPSRANRKRATEMINELGYDRALSIAKEMAQKEGKNKNWLYLYQAIVSLDIKSLKVKKEDWLPQFSVVNTQRMPYRYIESLYEQYKLKTVIGRAENLLSASKDIYRAKLQGTSVFSPALAHIAYDWFSKKGNTIFDPFCGGPVRGVVAQLLDRQYIGIDIRKEQISANKEVFPEYNNIWIQADATQYTFPQSDMILTCPPYYNLEIYSNLENDLSAQKDYSNFLNMYKSIIKKCCNSCNGYIVFVIGSVRENSGFLIDIPGDTIKAFDDYGFGLHNEIIIYSVGSATARINFSQQRVTNVHQKMLVFKRRS